MALRSCKFALLLVTCFVPIFSLAGGPLLVGGPHFGRDGQPFTWNPAAMPIQYRVDPGPMASTPTGTVAIDNATGLQRVQNMFGVWQAVPTASVSFTNMGSILPSG